MKNFFAFILLIIVMPLYANTNEIKVKSNYELFEEKTNDNNDTKIIKTLKHLPKIYNGFIVTKNVTKPIVSVELYRYKKEYSLDFYIGERTIGMTMNKIILPIVDIKLGIILGYSLEKDYRYHGMYTGISMSIVKF